MNICFTMQVLRRSLQNRISGYRSLQETITTRACVHFTHYLAQRGYDGKLRFIHEKERLEIYVCVCVCVCACMHELFSPLYVQVKVDVHSGLSQSTKNMKTLSGGERSYTTVCFIMSLWASIDAPFRCLDEFDVFMVSLVSFPDFAYVRSSLATSCES